MDTRFKVIFLIAVLFMTGLPLMGILRGTDPPPSAPEDERGVSLESPRVFTNTNSALDEIVKEEMVFIPAGEFVRGTNDGGYNERPQGVMYVEGFWIDQYEVTNHHYLEFVEATGHRKPGLPSRYARKMVHLRGPNQPVTYVSWNDAFVYCQWKGKRLPREAEWEKAVRGEDGRTWPWGERMEGHPANFGVAGDGFKYTAPVGSFPLDRSVFGVYDGAGNLMEWVDNWYVENLYHPTKVREKEERTSKTYKTLRGGGYTSRGIDLRITNRMFMVPDFRDETIGFRCAKSDAENPNEAVFAESK
jgi:formylglycine-generating enzyme required for sulfatase activity